ncbi:MAG: disulfide bond formation protein B [Minisyncoccia bacterium]
MNIYLFQRVLGVSILLLQILVVILIIYIAYKKITGKNISFLEKVFQDYGMWIAGITSLFAIVGSLVFSDYYMVEPCKLCWIQRILIYPQAIIMLIAAWKNDKQAWIYSLWLSVIGLLYALRQINEQFGITSVVPETKCALGEVSCAQIHMLEFGYITFPLVSATLFVFLIILYLLRKK